jgi:hypothetical protein
MFVGLFDDNPVFVDPCGLIISFSEMRSVAVQTELGFSCDPICMFNLISLSSNDTIFISRAVRYLIRRRRQSLYFDYLLGFQWSNLHYYLSIMSYFK